MENTIEDVRYALRSFRTNSGFMLAAVLALALGIGANTLIFSFADAVFLRALPYRDPDRIVAIDRSAPGRGLPGMPASIFIDWKQHSTAFERIAAYSIDNFNLTGSGEPERISCARVSAELFLLLGVEPVHRRV